MIQNPSSYSDNAHQRGFTLPELLTAMSITTLTMGLVLGSIFGLRDHFFTEIKRTQINSNLRSAMDIMSMNVRQTGENVAVAFPALALTNGTSGASDTLTLRRSPTTEVLTLCADITSGATSLPVSSADLANAECIPNNVAPVFARLKEQYDEMGDDYRLYLYDRSTRQGQFVDYTGATSGSQYSVQVTGVSKAFTQLNTSLYVIEEYQFTKSTTDDRLELTINQLTSKKRPVAFDVIDFQSTFTLQDGTSVTSFTQNATVDWKDVHQIELRLTGRDEFRGRTLTSTIASLFFPRNVLSYEGT